MLCRRSAAAPRAWELVDTWIAAERVRHLFVLRSHLLPPALCLELVDLASRADFDVWFIVRGRENGQVPAVADTGHHRWKQASFVERWAGVRRDDRPPSENAGFPEVPGDDFLTFRSSCRDLLDPASFERVDGVFCGALSATAAWLGGWQGR